jgi:hypothetical protein
MGMGGQWRFADDKYFGLPRFVSKKNGQNSQLSGTR